MGEMAKLVGMSRKGYAIFGRSGEPPRSNEEAMEGWNSETQRRLKQGERQQQYRDASMDGNGKEEGDGRHEGGELWKGKTVMDVGLCERGTWHDQIIGEKWSTGVGRREVEVRWREGRWYGNGELEHTSNCSFAGFFSTCHVLKTCIL